MHHAHKSFGCQWQKKSHAPKHASLSAFADTCAQTCTSGLELLQQLQCPESYLIPTTHGIQSMTDHPLKAAGALLLCIEAGDHQTRQVVYIADNVDGFYLSETALKDLGVIPTNYPNPRSSIKAGIADKKHRAPHGWPVCQTTCPPRADPVQTNT